MNDLEKYCDMLETIVNNALDKIVKRDYCSCDNCYFGYRYHDRCHGECEDKEALKAYLAKR